MSEPTQDKDDSRIFYDTEGTPCTLRQLVNKEPEWAVSRINYYMDCHPDMLEALESIENDDGSIPKAIWNMRNAAITKANGGLGRITL